MGDPITAAAITAGGGVLGSLIGGKGKPTQYTSGLSPEAQKVSSGMANYINQGMGRPIAYAGVNPMATNAMDIISRMFFGKPYQSQFQYAAQGGGPQQYGMPPNVNMNSRNFPVPGMPQTMGPQTPQINYYGRPPYPGR